MAGYRHKETICWDCKKASGLCSWSHRLIPVKGWTAEKSKRKTYEGQEIYCVIACPEFERG